MGTEAGKDKPVWRRVLEVLVPVAAFAVAAPFAVNGLANAIDAPTPRSASSAEEPEAPATPETTQTTAASTTAAGTATEASAPVTIAGVDAGADDQTIALASEIVSETATTATTVAADTTGATPTTIASGAGHTHGAVTPEVALTRAERAELGDQLALARAVAMRYPTVADALAGGYVKVVGYVPLIGSHYIKWASMDGNFDVSDPEMLLYDGTDPTSHIVGLSYYVFSDTVPSPFAGPNDHWHQHIGLCIKDGVVVGGEQMSAADCAARGGTKANAGNGWMVHAWVVPGWESPQGVFSPEHIGLTADLPNS
jgi:hypothetical protein